MTGILKDERIGGQRLILGLVKPRMMEEAKPVCSICKGHSRFDQCSCHYEGVGK